MFDGISTSPLVCIPTGMYVCGMRKNSGEASRNRLVDAATKLIRQRGYTSTSVDQICKSAGVTKGAFFHHFKSKEQLGEACLQVWDRFGESIDRKACEQLVSSDPMGQAREFMGQIISLFADPSLMKSCLAGTIAQEAARDSSLLRHATHQCFANAEVRLKEILDRACQSPNVDTASLASLWIATMQGSITLHKASGDEEVVSSNLSHVMDYILGVLESGRHHP